MELHAILTPESALQRQYWRGLSASMQLHEKRYIKRAGVAGIALRAVLFKVPTNPQDLAYHFVALGHPQVYQFELIAEYETQCQKLYMRLVVT